MVHGVVVVTVFFFEKKIIFILSQPRVFEETCEYFPQWLRVGILKSEN